MVKPKRSEPDRIWNVCYQLAKEYFKEHGDLLIPGDYVRDGKRLGAWIGTQRTDYKKRVNPCFTQDRIERLNAIGMVWDAKESEWQRKYKALLTYAGSYSTVRVPQSYITPDGIKLGIWVNRLRMDHKKGRLKEEKKKLLEQIGMIWEPEILRRDMWDVKFDLLKGYVSQNGVFPVAGYVTENGVKLGSWLVNQKAYHKKGVLPAERVNKLEGLGMVWNIAENNWEERYQQAKTYYLKYGYLCLYLQRGLEMPEGLANWLGMQRQKYHRGGLLPDQADRLEQIGMIWDVRECVWEERYQQAKAYYLQNGHLRIPRNSSRPNEQGLAQWISTQRKNYMTGQNPLFDLERVRRLEEIGMVWDASVDSESLWEEWYREAEDFYKTHGHLNPPAGKLRTWIRTQRGAKKQVRGSLSEEQVRRLEQIGMLWDPVNENWKTMYQYAKAYYQIHQKLNIPCNYVTEDGANLGIWISRQRKGYKNYLAGKTGGGRTVITPEHVKLLNDIEMIWDGATIMGSTSFQEKALLFYLRTHFPEAGKLDRWQEFGVELDIYIPSIKAAVEYDGCKWHCDSTEQDEKKGRICKSFGIRLIRIREPGLPGIRQCDQEIKLESLDESAFEEGIRRLFQYLKLPVPDCDMTRDRPAILETYRDFTSRKWDRIFQEVCEHCGESGDLFVPASAKTRSGVNIAGWINTQREAYRNNELTQMQIQKLEKAGMLWAPFEKRWQDMYELAKAYREEYGDLMIPHDYKTNAGENLGMWLSKQREKYRASQQTSHRIYMLEQLGIVWNPLGNRRDRYQLAALEKMGAQWDVRGDKWEAMFEVAENYYREYGNLWVSPAYISPKGEYLGSWISHQRRKACGKDRGRKLTAEQKKRLDGIGMVWNPFEAKWMNKYLLAKAFYLANGHLNIPSNFVCGDGTKLGMWLSSQRQAARGNPNYRMTPERRQMLDDIEMDWTLKSIRPDARHR